MSSNQRLILGSFGLFVFFRFGHCFYGAAALVIGFDPGCWSSRQNGVVQDSRYKASNVRPSSVSLGPWKLEKPLWCLRALCPTVESGGRTCWRYRASWRSFSEFG